MDAQVLVRSSQREDDKGWTQRERTELTDVSALRRGLVSLDELLKDLPELTSPAGWHLREIELTVELTATGGINLIGVATAGLRGGITVRLKRT